MAWMTHKLVKQKGNEDRTKCGAVITSYGEWTSFAARVTCPECRALMQAAKKPSSRQLTQRALNDARLQRWLAQEAR